MSYTNSVWSTFRRWLELHKQEIVPRPNVKMALIDHHNGLTGGRECITIKYNCTTILARGLPSTFPRCPEDFMVSLPNLFDCIYYQRKVLSLPLDKFTIVSPDQHSFRDSTHPLGGYVICTIAKDNDMTRSQEIPSRQRRLGTVVTHQLVPNLLFLRNVPPRWYGLENWSHLIKENDENSRWLWYINF